MFIFVSQNRAAIYTVMQTPNKTNKQTLINFIFLHQSSRSLLRRLSSDFSPGAASASAVSVARLSLHHRPGAVETMPRGPHSPADPSFHPLRPVEGSGDLVFDRERVLYVDGEAKVRAEV